MSTVTPSTCPPGCRYLGKESYLKTLNRPVGGKLKLFEQRVDEFAEDKLAMDGEMVNTLLYVLLLDLAWPWRVVTRGQAWPATYSRG